jgi:hypothetical protein
MALSILDGNQSATTLSTILSSGQHITAHTVVSLGTQAITDMRGAVSGSVVSISNFPSTQTIAGTVTANVPFADTFIKANGTGGFADTLEAYDEAVNNTVVAVHVKNFSGEVFGSTAFPISGTVTASLSNAVSPSLTAPYGSGDRYPVGAKIIPVGGWTDEVDGAHWQALSLTDSGSLYTYSKIAPSTNRIGVVTIGAGTVTIGAGTAQIGSVTASISGTVPISISSVTIGNSVTISSLPAISGTVTANLPAGVFNGDIASDTGGGEPAYGVQLGYFDAVTDGFVFVKPSQPLPISGTVTIGSLPAISGTVTVGGFSGVSVGSGALLAGGLRFGSVAALTLDGGTGYLQVKVESAPAISGTVTIGAGTAQIGSVTVGNSVTIGSFATSVTARLINPAGTAVTYAEVGTAGNPSIDVLSVQGVTSGTPLTILNHQGTTVTTSNFTSTTASTVLASANTSREVLTIFNEGAGNLHICAGATCTTIAYQVRLSAGDYYEVPLNQTSLTHSAVFATAGTARIVQIS